MGTGQVSSYPAIAIFLSAPSPRSRIWTFQRFYKMLCISFSFSFMSPVAYCAISFPSRESHFHSVLCILHGVSELKARWILWERNLQALKMRNTEDHKDCTICATLLYCTEGQLQMKFSVEWKLANPKLIACSWHNLVFQGGQFDLWLTSFSWSGLGIELWLFNDVPKHRILFCCDWTGDGLEVECTLLCFDLKEEVLGQPLTVLLIGSSTRKLNYQIKPP